MRYATWGGKDVCNNAQGLKNKMVATNSMVDKGRGVADNGVEILEAGEPEKKKISGVFVLHNAPEVLRACSKGSTKRTLCGIVLFKLNTF